MTLGRVSLLLSVASLCTLSASKHGNKFTDSGINQLEIMHTVMSSNDIQQSLNNFDVILDYDVGNIETNNVTVDIPI